MFRSVRRVRRFRTRSILSITILGMLSLAAPTSAGSGEKTDPEQTAERAMITSRYVMAAKKLPVPVVISHYKKCDLVSYAPELMAARTGTMKSNWHIIGKCKMSYSGNNIPRFTLFKDEAEWMCGCSSSVVQYPQKFNSNDFVIRFFTSKPGYFSTVKPPRVKPNDVPDYYSHNQGGWAPFTDGSLHYDGPHQVFVVDQNHIVCAYSVWWTSGYVVGSSDFTVIPDHLIRMGTHCEESHVVYR